MRQKLAGYLAAAGLYALDHHIIRLKEDHERAKKIDLSFWLRHMWNRYYLLETNIVVCSLKSDVDLRAFLSHLAARNIKAVAFGKQTFRMVTHLDVHDWMLDEIESALKNSDKIWHTNFMGVKLQTSNNFLNMSDLLIHVPNPKYFRSNLGSSWCYIFQ